MKKIILVFVTIICLGGISHEANAQEGFIGEVKLFAGNFAPRGWAFCDGQLLPIAQNTALFSLIGTIYGGDGRTTFALPDLRGRVPVSAGNGFGRGAYRLGSKGGQENVTLNATNLPNFNIAVPAYPLDPTDEEFLPKKGAKTLVAIGNAGKTNVYVNVRGGGAQSINNMQPFLAMHYIICTQGLFPSRN